MVSSLSTVSPRGVMGNRRVRAAGVLWRPEYAQLLDPVLADRPVDCVEVMFEDLLTATELPRSLAQLRERGASILLHGATLSLGGAERPERRRVDGMARVADLVEAPLVSEHLAFVRAGGLEAWHLMPLPWTERALDVFVANVAEVQRIVDRPFAIENVAYQFEWPDGEMDEATFVSEAILRTGGLMLLDVENVRINAYNYRYDPVEFIRAMPLQRLAYVHVAGGELLQGTYRDTHSERVPEPTLTLLEILDSKTEVPHVILERDQNLPAAEQLRAELDDVDAALVRGQRWRRGG
jgi:uncharacterized protein